MRTPLLWVVGIGLWTCKPATQPDAAQPEIQNPQQSLQSRLNKLNVQQEDAIQIDSSAYVMFPLSMREKEGQDESFIATSDYKEIKESTYWNVAFYHTKSHAYHLLDEQHKLLIYDINPESKESTPTPHIFYRVTTTDSNGDKRFTSDDLTYLFVSDRAGKDFRQLSPAGYDLISWERLKASTQVIMLVRKDSNLNHKDDEDDEKTAFLADLASPSPATEVFSPPAKQKLKELFDRDWKRVR